MHTCHAKGCSTPCAPRFFMCRRHWYKLDAYERAQIWAVYVPGQEERKDPSLDYLEVAQSVIDALAAREGK